MKSIGLLFVLFAVTSAQAATPCFRPELRLQCATWAYEATYSESKTVLGPTASAAFAETNTSEPNESICIAKVEIKDENLGLHYVVILDTGKNLQIFDNMDHSTFNTSGWTGNKVSSGRFIFPTTGVDRNTNLPIHSANIICSLEVSK